LGGAVAEKIAEDAGYSRGALYSYFDGKEDLFLAVIREEQNRRKDAFYSIFKQEPSAKQRLRRIREAIADHYTDPDWIVLRAEFEAGALRNERIRRTFVEVHREQVRDGGKLIGNLARSSEIQMGLKPNEFIMIILNLSHGLAVTQKILGAELSPKGTRHLIYSLFDRLISSS
jgi:AcrR family transcriptional regulator